jgi:hypothetical protein
MATIMVRDAAELGTVVRDARLLAGISQTELAADARVGRQWLVGFEARDKLSAPFDIVMRVLRVLELEVTLDPSVPARPVRRGQPFVPKASEVLARYEKNSMR